MRAHPLMGGGGGGFRAYYVLPAIPSLISVRKVKKKRNVSDLRCWLEKDQRGSEHVPRRQVATKQPRYRGGYIGEKTDTETNPSSQEGEKVAKRLANTKRVIRQKTEWRNATFS